MRTGQSTSFGKGECGGWRGGVGGGGGRRFGAGRCGAVWGGVGRGTADALEAKNLR